MIDACRLRRAERYKACVDDMPFVAPSARGRRGLENQNLFGNNIVPVAVLNDLVAVSNEDFTFADSDIGRVKLIERAALNGDSGSIVVLQFSVQAGLTHLKVPPSMVIFALSSAKSDSAGPARSLICKFAALDDNLGSTGGADGHLRSC